MHRFAIPAQPLGWIFVLLSGLKSGGGKCSGGLRRQGDSSIRPGLQAHARDSRGSGRSGIQDPPLPEERGWLTLEFSLGIPFHVCELGLLQPMSTGEREAGGHQAQN